MAEYSKTMIGNVGYTAIIDPKFKTQKVCVCFLTELDSKTASENAMAIGIIGSSNSKYKNISEITAKLNSLYGANISAYVLRRGDIQRLGINISSICNKYALEGEDISADVISILLDCLFLPNAHQDPNTGKTRFASEPFEYRRKDLLDTIEAEINNKRGYAILQANKSIFKGESCANSPYGTKDTAKAVTPESAYEAYQNLLKYAQIEIYYVGPERNPAADKMIADAFSTLDRTPSPLTFNKPSPLKSEVCRSEESLDVNQCKMVMAFKTSSNDIDAVKLMNTIFGATPFSKLFVNVREKQSLCYYCASTFNRLKKTIIVDCGIEEENIKKAENEISAQLEEIKNGNFSDEEIKNSLLSMINSLRAVGDTTMSYAEWYFNCYINGEETTPDQEAQKLSAVTRERIIAAAKSFEIDTVYVMRGEQNGN